MKSTISIIVIIVFSLGFVSEVKSQDLQDTITIVKKGGVYFTQNFQILSSYELTKRLKSNPEALEMLRLAKQDKITASILGIIGGACIGFPLGQAIAKGDPYWLLVLPGIAALVISIPFSSSSKDRTISAVEMYNEGIKNKTTNRVTLNLKGSNEGIGLVLKF